SEVFKQIPGGLQLDDLPFELEGHAEDLGVVLLGELRDRQLERRDEEGTVEEPPIKRELPALDRRRVIADAVTEVAVDVAMVLRDLAVTELVHADGIEEAAHVVEGPRPADVPEPGPVGEVEGRELDDSRHYILTRLVNLARRVAGRGFIDEFLVD